MPSELIGRFCIRLATIISLLSQLMYLVSELGRISNEDLFRVLPTGSLGRTTTRPTAILMSIVLNPDAGVQAAFASPYKPRPAVSKTLFKSNFFIYKPPQSLLSFVDLVQAELLRHK